MSEDSRKVLLIACGALAHEIVALKRHYGWHQLSIQCLPADYHNRPEKIAPAVAEKLTAGQARFASMFVAYGDCGTGGELDRVLEQFGAERLPGAHCYEFFAGADAFAALADDEPGTFYLTDFLARHFERLIFKGLGLDRHPELKDLYFGNYTRLVYLAQTEDAELTRLARAAADQLGLTFVRQSTGYGELETGLCHAVAVAPPVAAGKVGGTIRGAA